jgi:spectinomycin phosphotransferase
VYLRDHGLEQVVAAVPAVDGDPWWPLEAFTLLVYPWVDGVPAMERGLTDRQWVAHGRFVAALHTTALPAAPAATVARESFVPLGARRVRTLELRIDQDRHRDPLRRQLAGLWRAHRDLIGVAVDRAEELGRVLAAARPRLVLCHGDLHPANLLVGHRGRLAVVDWDGLLLGPRERDLCVVAGMAGGPGEARFFEGYGSDALDRPALAYYRWEWVVQELADYGGRVLDGRLGEQTRRQAVAEFRELFEPGDVVEAARRADRRLEVS